MKTIQKRLSFIMILATAVLSACDSSNISTETISTTFSYKEDAVLDEQTLKKHSFTYLEAFRKGQFDDFYKNVSNTLKTEFPQETFIQKWNSLIASARAYSGKQTEQIIFTDGKADVLVTSVHARYNLITSFTFSQEGIVDAISINLTPLIVEPESNEYWEEIPITIGYDREKQLNGMLTLPKNAENPPVTILVHGSGAQGMDCLIGAANNRPFADLAQGLAQNGIASIRFDKRSYVYPEDVINVETEYLYDVKDAVQFVLKDSRVDSSNLYLIGHSQGGMLSPKFALDNPEIKGIVSLGGTLRRIEDVILEQTETMMAQNAVLTTDKKNARIAKVKEELNRIHSLTSESTNDQTEILLGYPISYWISLNAINQQEIAKELNIPMLILQGDNDFQVLYETDFLLWKQVLAGKENVTFHNYAGLSHVFMPGSREHFDGSSYDAPAKMDTQVIQDIADWIHN